MIPSLGRIVHYTLSQYDADTINQRRGAGSAFQGNVVKEGDVFPLIITRVWGSSEDSAFNGQLMLDGNDTRWITSTSIGEGPTKCIWPPRV